MIVSNQNAHDFGHGLHTSRIRWTGGKITFSVTRLILAYSRCEMGDEHPETSVQFLLSRLRHIAALVMYAAEANTLPEVLQRIAEVSAELVRARYAALGVPDGKGGLVYFEVFGMTPEQIRRMDHPPIGKGLIGAIMRD